MNVATFHLFPYALWPLFSDFISTYTIKPPGKKKSSDLAHTCGHTIPRVKGFFFPLPLLPPLQPTIS